MYNKCKVVSFTANDVFVVKHDRSSFAISTLPQGARSMSYNVPTETRPDALIRLLRTLFTVVHIGTFVIVNSVAPEAYIDETFHVLQCQAYCHGRFTEWNNKITTRPGLYVHFTSWPLSNVLDT